MLAADERGAPAARRGDPALRQGDRVRGRHGLRGGPPSRDGAWDARLEALVVDGVVRGEPADVLVSRSSALGWDAQRPVTVDGRGGAPGPEKRTPGGPEGHGGPARARGTAGCAGCPSRRGGIGRPGRPDRGHGAHRLDALPRRRHPGPARTRPRGLVRVPDGGHRNPSPPISPPRTPAHATRSQGSARPPGGRRRRDRCRRGNCYPSAHWPGTRKPTPSSWRAWSSP